MTWVQERWWVLASPVLLAVTVGGVASGVLRARTAEHRGTTAAGLATAPPLPVRVLVLGDLAPPQIADRYRGVIVASKEAELAFRRSGRVESIDVTEGAAVKRGERLASLDASDLEAQIVGARSQVAEAEALLAEMVAGPRQQTIEAAYAEIRRLEATVELARSTANRQRSLLEVNASSAQQYDDARSSLDQQLAALSVAQQRLSELQEGTRAEQIDAQRSRVEGLRARLRSLEVDLEDSRIVAPFDGLIARRYLDEGAVVGPESRAMRLLQVDPLEARFGVSHDDAVSIRVGQSVTLTLDQETFRAVVSRIEPEVDLLTRTQGLYVTIDAGEVAAAGDVGSEHGMADLRSGGLTAGVSGRSDAVAWRRCVVPGQTVSLSLSSSVSGGDGMQRFASDATDELWVPLTALARAERGLWSLFAVIDGSDGGQLVERREVQVLAIEADSAQVAGALIAAGDQVVVGALHRIVPGMKVEPLR